MSEPFGNEMSGRSHSLGNEHQIVILAACNGKTSQTHYVIDSMKSYIPNPENLKK